MGKFCLEKNYKTNPCLFRFLLVLKFICYNTLKYNVKRLRNLRFGCLCLRLGMAILTNRGANPYVLPRVKPLHFGCCGQLGAGGFDLCLYSMPCESRPSPPPALLLQIGCPPTKIGSFPRMGLDRLRALRYKCNFRHVWISWLKNPTARLTPGQALTA